MKKSKKEARIYAKGPLDYIYEIMAAPNKHVRRELLAQVPDDWKQMVEYTVKDLFWRASIVKKRKQKELEAKTVQRKTPTPTKRQRTLL